MMFIVQEWVHEWGFVQVSGINLNWHGRGLVVLVDAGEEAEQDFGL